MILIKIVSRIFVLFCFFPLFLIAKQCEKSGWQLSELIWNGGIIALCDKGVDSDPYQFYKNEGANFLEKKRFRDIKHGEIIWVNPRLVSQFFEKILPEVANPFVMVVSGGDESFPSQSGLTLKEFENILEDKRLIHIFAQNCDYQKGHEKLTPIPIGLDFHTVAYKESKGRWGEKGSPVEQEKHLLEIMDSASPTYLRKKRAFVDFHHFDSLRKGCLKRYIELGEDRTSIFQQLMKTGLVDASSIMRRSSLWKIKSEYAFSISPHGNGLDCHRTWEDLALGCIVIVKQSPLDPLYEGLPVVIVKDWSEITEANLDKWLEMYKDEASSPKYREKISLKYWADKIQRAAQSSRR